MIGWLMIKEKLMEWKLAEETPKYLGENPLYWHFAHHKSHMTRPVL
jgi:predicted nicotinamide N-methyase